MLFIRFSVFEIKFFIHPYKYIKVKILNLLNGYPKKNDDKSHAN